MRKSLSKKITQILFLTSIGVVGYTAIETSNVYAKTLVKDVRSEVTVKQNKEKKSNSILNITEIEYGKFYSDKYEYRVNYNRDEIYEKAVSKVLVNGKEYSEGKGYTFHYYGLQLNPKEFTKDENKVVIIANGYNDIEMIIKKDGTLISYKENQNKAPLLSVGDNIRAEEGQPIDLIFGVNANDNKDGDLTAKIQVNKGKLDVNNPVKGFYTVIYSVTNSLGKTITVTKEVEVTERSNTASNAKVELVKVTDKIADGVYTLGFKAYKIDRPNETSMLGGFFDKNVKVTVKDGKINLKILNLMNAEMLYDFRVESKGKYSPSKSEWVGESNTNGEYFMQTFEFPIEDLLSDHKGCVLVGAMGGNKSDIGNTDKYTKTKIVFNKVLKKGWNGFEILNKQKSSDDLLNTALKYMLSDEDGDGKISNEEISRAKGAIELVNYKFKDITRLKYLGKGVTRLNLEANKIDKLPQDIFDNLVNLEHLQLNGNQIKELPKGIFDKLTNLKTLILSANKIEKLPKGIFDKLVKLEDIQLATNKIIEIEDDVFDKLTNIKSIYIPDNNIKRISDNAFGNLKNLKNIILTNNKLENIPKGIGNLKNLEFLSLNNNNISSIPNEIGKLNKLTDIDLSKNYIKDIPKEVYSNLKNIRKLDISDNQIKEVPKNILDSFPNAYKLDFSMNKIKNVPKIKNTDAFIGCPQKTEMNLTLSAKDGEIKWKQNMDALDMLYWSDMITRDKPKDLNSYEKFMENEKGSKNIKDIIPFEWTIINEIQRKNSDGKYETIKKFTTLNDNDMLNGKINDPNMKKGSEYRLVKSFFTRQGNVQLSAFNDVATIVAESDALKNQINSINKNKSYDLKVKILKENEDKPSMAGNYIKKVTYEIKDVKHYIIVKLNRSDWMKNIKATIDGKEITPQMLNKEKNSNGEETNDIKFEVRDLNSKIVLGMNVEPMGNNRVSFRIVPEEESLNLIKADEIEENTKDNQEIKNEEVEKENNKESSKPKETTNKDEQSQKEQDLKNTEELKKEIKKKKIELEKINSQIEKSKKKIKEEKNKLNNSHKEKNATYNINFDILKENEDKPSMAGSYIKKVTYQIKNGNHYIVVNLNRSDWMKNIKATIDGKEITPEVLNKEKNSNGEETSDIKFEVKDLNSKIALGMNVKPMGNARVLFRIVPNKTSIIETSFNPKPKDLKNNLEVKKAKLELKKIKIEFEKAKLELEKAKLEKENNKDLNNPKEELKYINEKDKEIANTQDEKIVKNLSNKTDLNINKNEKNKDNNEKQISKEIAKKDKETVDIQQEQSLGNLLNKTNIKSSDNLNGNKDEKSEIEEINKDSSTLKELPRTGNKISKFGLVGFSTLLISIGTVLFRKKR